MCCAAQVTDVLLLQQLLRRNARALHTCNVSSRCETGSSSMPVQQSRCKIDPSSFEIAAAAGSAMHHVAHQRLPAQHRLSFFSVACWGPH
jgi:hypothetical protein